MDGVAKIKIIHCTCINNTIPMIQRVLIFTSFLICPKKKKHEEQLLTSIFYIIYSFFKNVCCVVFEKEEECYQVWYWLRDDLSYIYLYTFMYSLSYMIYIYIYNIYIYIHYTCCPCSFDWLSFICLAVCLLSVIFKASCPCAWLACSHNQYGNIKIFI